ncbi:hypothetical protein NUACC21_55850 [Scytonema sp. NUACC21]
MCIRNSTISLVRLCEISKILVKLRVSLEFNAMGGHLEGEKDKAGTIVRTVKFLGTIMWV